MSALAFDFDRTRRSRRRQPAVEPHGDATRPSRRVPRRAVAHRLRRMPAPLPAPLAPPPQARRPHARPQPRRPADRVRQGDADRPLSAAGRKLPGHVRARLLRLCRRCRACPAALRRDVAGSGSCRRRPILSNGGTKRGLPISCFLNDVSDSLDGIVGTWNENVGAGLQWRRHRHLLGQGPLHRRKGEDRRDLAASFPSSM